MHQVLFTKKAQKEFDKLPALFQQKIEDVLALLAHNPLTEVLPIKKLKGIDSLYRIRIGNYRLLYEIRKSQLVVVVIKIGHRKDVYRHLHS